MQDVRSTIDPLKATREEIVAAAAWLEGRRLDRISSHPGLRQPPSPKVKGVVGAVVETYFGILPNSRAEADFAHVGIELKTVPIQQARDGVRAKERISLGMINYGELVGEAWPTAKVRAKLDRLLLVFYQWEPLRPMGYFRILVARIWEPDPLVMKSLEHDWRTIRDVVVAGRTGELSESLTRVLGAATKGPGHGSTTRAWSLKQPFVGWLYERLASPAGSARSSAPHSTMPKPAGALVSPSVAMPADPAAAFEVAVLSKLRQVEGVTTGALADRLGISPSRAKSADSLVIRRLLGQPARGRSGEFERFGVELKTVPVALDGTVLEAMSFPAFIHEELVYESWEDSDLLGRLNRMLLVPLERGRRVSRGVAIVRRAFFWSPSERELDGIRTEWTRFRLLIEGGQARDLPTAADTDFIHVRPHGRRALDADIAPGGFNVTRKSFWLNQRFVERIVSAAGRAAGDAD